MKWPQSSREARTLRLSIGIGSCGTWQLEQIARTPERLTSWIVPDRIRGRIFAFDGALITATFAVSSVATGYLADVFGARPVATGLGLIGLAYAGVWTWLTTNVRRATMLDGCGRAPNEREASVPEVVL